MPAFSVKADLCPIFGNHIDRRVPALDKMRCAGSQAGYRQPTHWQDYGRGLQEGDNLTWPVSLSASWSPVVATVAK